MVGAMDRFPFFKIMMLVCGVWHSSISNVAWQMQLLLLGFYGKKNS
jgi:hypothetical protein